MANSDLNGARLRTTPKTSQAHSVTRWPFSSGFSSSTTFPHPTAISCTRAALKLPYTAQVIAVLSCSVRLYRCIARARGARGKWDEDDKEFEVDDARCNDGKKYDLTVNADYTFKRKELDD